MEVPLDVSAELLAPGVDEYSYSAGFVRQDIGSQSFSYGNPAFLFFHRIGVTDWLTMGARGEASPSMVNGGPTATFTLGLLGALSAALALSDDGGAFGYGVMADYEYQNPVFGASISARYQSPDYANASLAACDNAPLFAGTVSLGVRLAPIGSIFANAGYTRMRDGTDRVLCGLSYSRQIGANLMAQASLFAQVQSGAGVQLNGFAGARLLLGKAVADVSYTQSDGGNGFWAGIERSVGRGNGFGYSARVDEGQPVGQRRGVGL